MKDQFTFQRFFGNISILPELKFRATFVKTLTSKSLTIKRYLYDKFVVLCIETKTWIRLKFEFLVAVFSIKPVYWNENIFQITNSYETLNHEKYRNDPTAARITIRRLRLWTVVTTKPFRAITLITIGRVDISTILAYHRIRTITTIASIYCKDIRKGGKKNRIHRILQAWIFGNQYRNAVVDGIEI